MAYTAGNLHLLAGAPGDLSYTYDAAADTQATVLADGYFNNTDDDLNLTVDDLIWCQCTDGNMWLRVSAISSGTVTCQFAGGNVPIQASASGVTTEVALTVGHYVLGSAHGTSTEYVLPAPYPGAEVIVIRGSGSGGHSIDIRAGTNTAVGYGATTIAVSGRRTIRLARSGEGFHVRASGTTRWDMISYQYMATGASASAGGGASNFFNAT